MIVPPSQLPTGASGPLAPEKPSPALLLMAAAEMHKMGRLGRKGKAKTALSAPDDTGEAA